jgi:hypothetical protein
MSNKQSSVEQLVNSLIKLGYLHSNGFGQSLKVTEVINHAKATHKEEIEKAYNESFRLRDKPYSTAIKYYNETFGDNNEQ